MRIFEAGARDGLQNEAKSVPTAVKIELINRLVDAGLKAIEGGAFVHPKWVPQVSICFLHNTDVHAATQMHC